MESSWPENLPSDRMRAAIQEVLRGRELANQLKIALTNYKSKSNTGDLDASSTVKDLVTKILDSFTTTLSVLNKNVESDEVSQFPESRGQLGSPAGWNIRKSEDSGDSSKSTSTFKERRGCYKRRKTQDSWTKDAPTLIDDGHAWRKYGQKFILNAKFPRNYFRCTHKYDQQCPATKQVQRIQEEPPLFRTTYHGHHTCKNLLKPCQFIFDATDDDTSVLLSFNNNNNNSSSSNNNNSSDHLIFSSYTPSIKKEEQYSPNKDHDDYDIPTDQLMTAHNQQRSTSSSDFLLSPSHLPSFDHTDVISGVKSSSCTTSTQSLSNVVDIDMMVGSVGVDFDDEDVLQQFAF